jgi:hypothetical protein
LGPNLDIIEIPKTDRVVVRNLSIRGTQRHTKSGTPVMQPTRVDQLGGIEFSAVDMVSDVCFAHVGVGTAGRRDCDCNHAEIFYDVFVECLTSRSTTRG